MLFSQTLFLHPLLKRTHRGSKKFYVLLTHHPFFFFSFFFSFFLCPCTSVCVFVYICQVSFFFCHLHCLNYVTTYSLLWDNFVLVYEWVKRQKRTLDQYIDEYVYSFLNIHSSEWMKRKRKNGEILDGLGRTGAETLSIYLSLYLSIYRSVYIRVMVSGFFIVSPPSHNIDR